MIKKSLLIVVLISILGSPIVSRVDAISSDFKSLFYGISMAILVFIGLVNIYIYFRKSIN